jgi:LCP family protein required for cell wall assembly
LRPGASTPGRPRWLAALLSFLWPGLGQLYAGRRRLAIAFAVPAALVLLVLIYQMRQGLFVFGTRLINPDFALGAFVVVLLLGAWRIAAVAHAFLVGEALDTRRTLERAVLAALVVVIVASHSAAGYMLWVTYNAGSNIFGGPDKNGLVVTGTPGPSLPPGVTPEPTPEQATPPPPGSRVTILFTGVDADPTRGEHLYDSIMVVSYDPPTKSVQMVSVPRDSACFPLYYGGQVSTAFRINSLPTNVRAGFKSPDDPYPTLVKEVSYLVGIPINYYAIMDLNGFVKMIDTVGGIDVNNQAVINDGSYDWLGAKPGYGFYLSAGRHHLDGIDALAYVRSRHGDSDYARASRQQEVLLDLLHKMSEPSQILKLPDLISTLGSSATTTFPKEQIADFVAEGQAVPSENIKQAVLSPPTYSLYNGNGSTRLLMDKVAELSIQLFGKDSTWSGKTPPNPPCPQ